MKFGKSKGLNLRNRSAVTADSGLQLDLEIALSGVPAKVQPHGLLQPGRRCVETSGDVIKTFLPSTVNFVKRSLSRIDRRRKFKGYFHFIAVALFRRARKAQTLTSQSLD